MPEKSVFKILISVQMTIFLFVLAALFTFRVQAAPVSLPKPNLKHRTRNFSKVLGWPEGKTPAAPSGFTVSKYAEGLQSPRTIYVGPNGDIFVAESQAVSMKGIKKLGARIIGASKSTNTTYTESANRITLLRDKDQDGVYDTREIFLADLDQPYGLLIMGDYFYVANQSSAWRYPYKTGETVMKNKGQKILDLPEGKDSQHWTRTLAASADGKKIFIAVGSGSNVGEKGLEYENRRASVLEINPDGTGEKLYASGIRNPAGLAISPESKKLWAAVNERDNIGEDLVPDYLTEVQAGGFYGWPFAYWGTHPDPRLKGEGQDLVKRSLTPDLSLGAHTASLGLTFYDQKEFPSRYANGAFVGQHGSWNRKIPAGYKVVFIPFKNGKPNGEMEDFLTGFVSNEKKNEVYGRPVGVAVLKDGSILVADDAANVLWNVSAIPTKPQKALVTQIAKGSL